MASRRSHSHGSDRTHGSVSPCSAWVASDVARTQTSVNTYTSTDSDDQDDDNDGHGGFPDDASDLPNYNALPDIHDSLPTNAIPTTPRDFADLFPTSKRVSIRHDDSTMDGNMNLRVDTQVEGRDGLKLAYTLFHLRMHDLRARHFSLRRYSRDSGREVCHSTRKYQKPPPARRPVLQRASTAIASLGLKHKPDVRPSTSSVLERSDSGYESMRGPLDVDGGDHSTAGGQPLVPTNVVKLEFSNYAHYEVHRRGTKANKRYTFEYWGHHYTWRRMLQDDGLHERVSYYLVRDSNDKEPLAHICPVHMTREQAHEEAARGGWVPPSYMRITDDSILGAANDIADVLIATGLVVLVDDSIKRRFHAKQSTQLRIPLVRNASFRVNVESIAPKWLLDDVLHRNRYAS